jgi:hypothetical protein
MVKDRWAWLEGIRPQALEDAIASEMAKVIASELGNWLAGGAPQVELTDPRLASLFAQPPSSIDLREGFTLARFELHHDLDALRLARPSPTADLVRLYLTETLYTLSERTQHRLKRRHLIASLDQAEKLLPATRSGPAPPSGGSSPPPRRG